MKRWSWFLVAPLVVFAGCGSAHKSPTAALSAGSTTSTSAAGTGSSAAPATPPAPLTPTAGTPTVPATISPPNTEPVETTVPPAPRRCSSSQLAGSLGSANGTAGTIYYQLELRNTGGVICFVQGYPGVSFVAGADGHQVGGPGTRMAGPTPRVVLTPAQSAAAALAIVDATNFGTPCGLTDVLGLRVYPPDQTAALFVPHTDNACANTQDHTLRIGPLQPA